jgi:hypothetical protein
MVHIMGIQIKEGHHSHCLPEHVTVQVKAFADSVITVSTTHGFRIYFYLAFHNT